MASTFYFIISLTAIATMQYLKEEIERIVGFSKIIKKNEYHLFHVD